MTLDQRHPAFDPTCELLVTLPVSQTPRGKLSASLVDLAGDLRLDTYGEVLDLAADAERRYGVRIVRRQDRVKGGRSLALHPSSFERARVVGAEYLSRVYGV
jgi:hypothetical protein